MRGQSYARGGASIHLDQCGLRLCPPLPFLPLIEEKEAKEDQGDDRHQVCWEDSMLQNFSPLDTAKAP